MKIAQLAHQELKELEAFGIGIARQAGMLLQQHFQKPLAVEYKDKARVRRDPVTEADKRSEELLKEAILRELPGHGILAEEGSQVESANSDFLWVLDPLDGTSNFMSGLPLYAVSVGLLRHGKPVLGCIFIPSTSSPEGSIFHASLGGGAFRDDQPIRVSENPQPEGGQLMIMPSFYARLFRAKRRLTQQMGDLRAPGSIAYELAMTASGVFQYAVFNRARIWDIAAGIPLVTEAGGIALADRWKGRGWETFEDFSSASAQNPTPQQLKDWSGSWIFGNASIARFVASNLRRRSNLELRIRRWLRRWF